jgi:hypothetical protein
MPPALAATPVPGTTPLPPQANKANADKAAMQAYRMCLKLIVFMKSLSSLLFSCYFFLDVVFLMLFYFLSEKTVKHHS